MGAVATLKLGRLTIDENKGIIPEYAFLFQPSDLQVRDEELGDGSTVPWNFFSKPLREVAQRLELLGYSVARIEEQVVELLRNASMHDDEEEKESREGRAELASTLSARDIAEVISSIKASDERLYDAHELRYYIWYTIKNQFVRRFPTAGKSDLELFEAIGGSLGTMAILRLLALNPENVDLELIWDVGEITLDDEVPIEDIAIPLPRDGQFLLATEGRSDARILRHAFSLGKPFLADFFYYIDVSEGYPFSGTGNLYNFCKGLIAIGTLNRTIVVYDNDAAGLLAFYETQKLSRPENIEVIKLPDLSSGNTLPTIGPNGTSTADINGKAAAIECYLDLGSIETPPVIRWRSYEKRLDTYQGELESKHLYEERFLLQADRTNYDFSKIDLCLDAIVDKAASMASRLLLELNPFGVYDYYL